MWLRSKATRFFKPAKGDGASREPLIAAKKLKTYANKPAEWQRIASLRRMPFKASKVL